MCDFLLQGFAHAGLQMTPSLDSSQQISKSLTFPSFSEQPAMPLIAQSPQGGGVGRGVSLSAVKEGWAINPIDKRRYVMEFGTQDRAKSGYLLGSQVKPVLDQSGLEKSVLAKIW